MCLSVIALELMCDARIDAPSVLTCVCECDFSVYVVLPIVCDSALSYCLIGCFVRLSGRVIVCVFLIARHTDV